MKSKRKIYGERSMSKSSGRAMWLYGILWHALLLTIEFFIIILCCVVAHC
jgi:hypothetical protein